MKNSQRGYTLYELLITIMAVGMLLLFVFAIIAGIHYTIKYW